MHKSSKSSRSDYYEGILQIRPRNKELYDFVINQVRKNNISIAKELDFDYGYDFYLSSRKFTTQLGKKLTKSFKGEIKISKSLYGRHKQTSKDLYRITVFFRKF